MIETILSDDEYREVGRDEVNAGDLVVYRRAGAIAHAGLVVQVRPAVEPEIWVISQWGADGEYSHRVDDVPVIYGDPSYWTDRR